MKTLTKDQLQKLTPEQQKDVAVLELQRERTRQRLLDHVRGYRGRIIADVLGAIVIGPLMFLPVFFSSTTNKVSLLLISASIGFLWVLTALRSNLINRRIDALMELVEHELQDTAPSVKSGVEQDS